MITELPTKPVLTLAAAKEIKVAAQRLAQANGWNVVVAIIDDGGHLLLLERMDGTQLASVDFALKKATSALIYQRPTSAFEAGLLGGRQAVLALPRAIPVPGGQPLYFNGELIGAIGISGVTAEQDDEIAKAGAAVLSIG